MRLQGYLAHQKQRPFRTQQQDYAQGLMDDLEGGAVFDKKSEPVLAT